MSQTSIKTPPPRPYKSQMFRDLRQLEEERIAAEEALRALGAQRALEEVEESKKVEIAQAQKTINEVKKKIEKAERVEEKISLFFAHVVKNRGIHVKESSEGIDTSVKATQKAVIGLSELVDLVPAPASYFILEDNKWKLNASLSDEDKKKVDGPIFFPRVDGAGKQIADAGKPVFDILYFENGKLNPEKSFVAPDDESSRAVVSDDLRNKIISHHMARSHTKPKSVATENVYELDPPSDTTYMDMSGATGPVVDKQTPTGVSNPMYGVGETKDNPYDVGGVDRHIYEKGPLPFTGPNSTPIGNSLATGPQEPIYDLVKPPETAGHYDQVVNRKSPSGNIYEVGPLRGFDDTYDLVVDKRTPPPLPKRNTKGKQYDNDQRSVQSLQPNSLYVSAQPQSEIDPTLGEQSVTQKEEADSFDRNSPLPSPGWQNYEHTPSTPTRATPYAVVDIYESVLTNVPENTYEKVGGALESNYEVGNTGKKPISVRTLNPLYEQTPDKKPSIPTRVALAVQHLFDSINGLVVKQKPRESSQEHELQRFDRQNPGPVYYPDGASKKQKNGKSRIA